MNWNFDFGATATGGEMKLNRENALAKVAGSKNLTLTIEKEMEIIFNLDVRNEKKPRLKISEK